MINKAFEQMMSGLKEAKDEYRRTVIPDCSLKYYAVRDAIELLKKQEAVEPKRDAECPRMFRCSVCGEYVGFVDPDSDDPNEQDNYCRNCGQKVKWNECNRKGY